MDVIPSPLPQQKKWPSDPLGDLQRLVTKDICKFALVLYFAEIRERNQYYLFLMVLACL